MPNLTELNGLNASRKANREKIADALCAIAEAQGAAIVRRDSEANPGFCGQGIDLRFELNGVGAMVDIDNLHGGEYALISWYSCAGKPEGSGRYLCSRFNRAVGEQPLGRKHWKATTVPADWYSLAMYLEGGLTLAARKEAFEPELEAA